MTDTQDRLLAMQDGRYFGASKFYGGLMILVKAERLGKRSTVDFGLPSGPALFLNLARRAFLKTRECEPEMMFRTWQNSRIPINHSTLFDFFEQYISHVVFAFTALEAFANEAIPNGYKYQRTKEGATVTLSKPDIERSLSLDEKLHKVLPGALGVETPKGKRLWQRYRQIKTMRDRIIHLKAVDYSPQGPDSESVWGMMLRSHREPFCDHAHEVIGHYAPAVNRRWFREYPYKTVEPDNLIGSDSSSVLPR